MTSDQDLRALARRAVGRALSERGRTEHAGAHGSVPGVERMAGIHVTVEPEGEPLRPKRDESRGGQRGGAELVTVDDLRRVPDGGRFDFPRGAQVTALAREEAWRRRIALVERGLTAAGDARREDGRVRLAFGGDHGGFATKRALLEELRGSGHVLLDLGSHDENSVDYPDYARAVAEAVSEGRADIGVCIDGAGIGSAMAANKVPGVRAANCWDVASAKNAREHNYANVLTLGGKRLSPSAALEILQTFLSTPWGEERHGRRIAKITAIERHYARAPGARATPSNAP